MAALAAARDTAGSSMCLGPPVPLVGSQPSVSANRRISSRASQKAGMERGMWNRPFRRRSGQRPYQAAAAQPSATPAPTVRAMA